MNTRLRQNSENSPIFLENIDSAPVETVRIGVTDVSTQVKKREIPTALRKSSGGLPSSFLRRCRDTEVSPEKLASVASFSSRLENITNNADGQNVFSCKSDRFKPWKYRYIAQSITKNHRVNSCSRLHYKDTSIEVWQAHNKKSYYKNLFACSSVWACPVCRYKILNKRKSEIIELCKRAQADGLKVGFLSLTQQHKLYRSISQLNDQMHFVSESWRYLMSIPALKRMMKKARFEYVRGLDTRYNKKNGFHPHLHLILFADSREDLQFISDTIIDYWITRSPESTKINQRYRPVYDNFEEQLTNYITKMNLADEITNPYMNKKSNDSINPLDTLRLIEEKDFTDYSYDECVKIYNDFIHVTKGMRSITYSAGFKKKYKITELTDADIVNDTSELRKLVIKVSDDVFKTLRDMNETHSILKAIDKYNADPGLSLISELRKEIFNIIGYQVSIRNNILVCDEFRVSKYQKVSDIIYSEYKKRKTALIDDDDHYIYDTDLEAYSVGNNRKQLNQYKKEVFNGNF